MTHQLPHKQNAWQFLWQIIKPFRWWYALMLQAPILTGFYVLANNYSMKLLVDAFSNHQTIEYSHLMYPIALFISAQIALDIIWRASNYAEWEVTPKIRRSILLSAYDYVQHHSFQYFQNTPSGTIISKIKGLLDGYDTIYSNVSHTVGKNFVVVIISIVSLLLVSVPAFVFMLVWCAVFIAIMLPMAFQLNRLSNCSAESKHQVIGVISDNITNIFSLFYFAKRKAELNRVHEIIDADYVPRQNALYRSDFKFGVVGAVLFWILLLCMFLFMVALRKNGQISTGDFIFVMLTTIAISFDLWSFLTGLCDFMKVIGDFKASYSIMATPQDVIDHPDAKAYEFKQGDIEFRNVGFAYQAENRLFSNLNLSIQAGEKVGIIGHSGSGKSTLISLLLKNFKPTQGQIFIHSMDIDMVQSDSLREQIALIPQDIMLFHRSIADNIGYAKQDASIDEIKTAAKLAKLDEYIESLPEKYETIVGERGVKLSGGQRQRIAIARAILKDAPIIILDEATSSLDSITEQEIQQSIHLLLEENQATVIAIAHRLSTIRNMDRIIVMGDGQILEQGSFDQLMNNEHGYFKKLWDSQVNGMIL